MLSRFTTKFLAASAVALALSQVGVAQAAEYEFTFTGTDIAGEVFATTTGANVTAITGWVTDSEVGAGTFNVTGISWYAGADNLFDPTSPWVDFAGISFSTAAGGDYNLANIGSSGAPQLVLLSSVLNPGGVVQAVGLTDIALGVSVVPEPGSMSLILAGIGMMGLVASRRRSRN
jgi:hypothetical protein